MSSSADYGEERTRARAVNDLREIQTARDTIVQEHNALDSQIKALQRQMVVLDHERIDAESELDYAHNIWTKVCGPHLLSGIEILPAELRNMIYEEILADKATLVHLSMFIALPELFQDSLWVQDITDEYEQLWEDMTEEVPFFVDTRLVSKTIAAEIMGLAYSKIFDDGIGIDCEQIYFMDLFNDHLDLGIVPGHFLTAVSLPWNLDRLSGQPGAELEKFETDLEAIRLLRPRPGLRLDISFEGISRKELWKLHHFFETFRATYNYIVEKEIEIEVCYQCIYKAEDFRWNNRFENTFDIDSYFAVPGGMKYIEDVAEMANHRMDVDIEMDKYPNNPRE